MSKKKRMCVVRIFNHDHNTTLRLSHESLPAMVDLATKMYLNGEIEGFSVGWK